MHSDAYSKFRAKGRFTGENKQNINKHETRVSRLFLFCLLAYANGTKKQNN